MSTFKNMRLLNHPFAFNPLISANGAEDLMSVLKLDQLEELSFEMKYDNPEYATAFKLIRES